MSKKLFIDKRVVLPSGSKSQIGLENPTAIHTFIKNYIASVPTIVTSLSNAAIIPYIEATLATYADNAAAVTAGLTVGQLYKNSTSKTISYRH